MSFIYLASPYSHPSLLISELRFRAVEIVSGEILRKGITVYSPIVYCHMMSTRLGLPADARFWFPHNRSILKEATSLWILTLPGWDNSIGVEGERRAAEEFGLKWQRTAPETWGAGEIAEALLKLA